ncbi:DNA replication/repair protein RecF [Haliea sp. E17]|uniref:DNA replication/repair protein RecF n=1 Tax=Haliea sp. E17 TaxID=3401576 RepID=UPI003AAB5A9A
MPASLLYRLQISGVRNLRQVRLDELGPVNVFFGPNGSGKTSALEAIHLLGMARSFRGNPRSLITHGESSCTVFGQLVQGNIGLGVEREMGGEARIRVSGNPIQSVSELVEYLPLQVINADSFDLLNGPPAGRRRFLDLGVFHVEHGFYPQWKRYQRGIKQRNNLLRRGKIPDPQLPVWTREVADTGEAITSFRRAYFERLATRFLSYVQSLAPALSGIELRYRRGWDSKLELIQALESSLVSDLDQGFTHVGPQRADVRVLIEGRPAAEVLSRGQQKLVVCALKLAQGEIMAEAGGRSCIYLIDDLPSELDRHHAALVCSAIAAMDNIQAFVTCVEGDDLRSVWPPEKLEQLKMFHVEHGTITSVTIPD